MIVSTFMRLARPGANLLRLALGPAAIYFSQLDIARLDSRPSHGSGGGGGGDISGAHGLAPRSSRPAEFDRAQPTANLAPGRAEGDN